MKVKITIEEVINQTFEVEVSDMEHAYEEVRKMYRAEKLVLDDPTLTFACVAIHEQDECISDWLDLHV